MRRYPSAMVCLPDLGISVAVTSNGTMGGDLWELADELAALAR
jgi:hypothetical protein